MMSQSQWVPVPTTTAFGNQSLGLLAVDNNARRENG